MYKVCPVCNLRFETDEDDDAEWCSRECYTKLAEPTKHYRAKRQDKEAKDCMDIGAAYYVYVWWNNETNTPFYVGKGKGYRAWETSHNQFAEGVRAYLGDKFEVRIISKDLKERDAFLLESSLINCFKQAGWQLTNIISGETPYKHRY